MSRGMQITTKRKHSMRKFHILCMNIGQCDTHGKFYVTGMSWCSVSTCNTQLYKIRRIHNMKKWCKRIRINIQDTCSLFHLWSIFPFKAPKLHLLPFKSILMYYVHSTYSNCSWSQETAHKCKSLVMVLKVLKYVAQFSSIFLKYTPNCLNLVYRCI